MAGIGRPHAVRSVNQSAAKIVYAASQSNRKPAVPSRAAGDNSEAVIAWRDISSPRASAHREGRRSRTSHQPKHREHAHLAGGCDVYVEDRTQRVSQDKKQYDPRTWMAAAEASATKRLLTTFEDLNCVNRNA